jgi:hypothetical protein
VHDDSFQSTRDRLIAHPTWKPKLAPSS